MASGFEGALEEEEMKKKMVKLGSYKGKVRLLMVVGETESESEYESAAEETMLLWGIQQPTHSKPNAFVSQSSLQLCIDACGHSLSILQSPSSLSTPGVTGSVMWDSGVVCIAALLGGQVILTDLPDRLRLLKKNVETNLRHGNLKGSAVVKELTWGDDPDQELIQPLPDYDSILEYFLEAAMKDFVIGRVEQTEWHPDYCSRRVAMYILVKK
ncbi:hypothetical protein EZV62_024307 [Acer yangbiense]|uniref:Uncharacterized protein n=1 Tax=Acer yangbiense TaxID=1000413 RepID=A0A5C7H453_9ROSI|nr:hypothetical protein EZV62_024307 [Acer yangbiense]